MLLARIKSFFKLGSRPEEQAVLKVQLLVLLAINVLLSIGYYGQREWRRIADEHHVPLIIHVWDGLAWYVWLLAAPVMLVLIHRFPLVRGQLPRNIGGLVIGSLVIYAVVANLRFGLRVLPDLWLPDAEDVPAGWSTYLNATLTLLPIDFLTYCGFFAVSFAVDYSFKFRRRGEEAAQLELQTTRLQFDLSQAELSALRHQLHPHFLFNSFNAVATLVRQKKNDAAVETIAQLSTLFRLATDRKGLPQIPLEEEFDFICRYLEIERVRFGEKLQLDFAIEPDALPGLVPTLVLQPLVENAIKHGISRRTDPGCVRVAAQRQHERLVLEVANDGPEALPADGPRAGKVSGIGLSNTRARLERLYGVN
jgi:two-component system LytT family sensor kinase